MVENLIAAWLLVMGAVLVIIAILSYRRSGENRLLVVSLAFLAFFVKGLLWSLHLFFAVLSLTELLLIFGSIDVLILVIFYLATLKGAGS